jgi:acetyl esterase/lipase
MKRNYAVCFSRLLVLFAIALTATTALAFQSIKQPKAGITGRITEPTGDKIQIDNKTAEISGNGSFQLNMDVKKPSFYTLRYGNDDMIIYSEPGDSIDISFDAKNISSSLQFKGKLAQINSFLKSKRAIDKIVDDYLDAHYLVDGMHSAKLESAAKCIFVIDSMKSLYLDQLKGFLSGNENVSERFVNLYKADINLTLNFHLLRYLDYVEFRANQNFKLVGSVPEINNYLSQTNIDDPAIIGLQEYERYCGYLLYLKVSEELQENSSMYTSNHQWLDAMFNVVPRLFKNQDVLDYWLYNEVSYYIDNDGIKNIEGNLQLFYASCKTKEFKDDIRSSYDNELQRQKDHIVKTYKTVKGYSLDAHIFAPKGLGKDDLLPAMVIFHGGSWYEGKPDWEFGYADSLVNVCIEYRTRYRYGSTVFDEVSDAKSAIRWLRMHAQEFHIDPHKIIATGNSAGAHLALCTAMADTLDEPDENKAVSSKPDALVLNSAGYDATIYFTESQKNAISKISPIHLVKENLPPMLIFHGTIDTDTPYKYAVDFVQKMKEKGNLVRIQPIEGSGHAIWASDIYWKVYGKVRSEFFKEIGIQ